MVRNEFLGGYSGQTLNIEFTTKTIARWSFLPNPSLHLTAGAVGQGESRGEKAEEGGAVCPGHGGGF